MRRKNFTQTHTIPFRKASEAGRRVKERGGRVQADKQVMKEWAEGDGRVECGPCRRDITRFAVSTGTGKGSSGNDGTCLKGRETRRKGSNSSERAAADEAQFTQGGERKREHPRKTSMINSAENHGEGTENKGGKKGLLLQGRKKERKKGNGQLATEAPI